MEQIAAEAGCDIETVRRHFPDHDALVTAMAEEEHRRTDAILQRMRDAASLPQALGAATRRLAERYRADEDAALMTELYAEGLRNPRIGTALRRMEAERMTMLAAMLRVAQARGQVDASLDPAQTALFLTGMWDGAVLRQHFHAHDDANALPAFYETMIVRLLARDPQTEPRRPAMASSLFADFDEMIAAVDKRQMNLI